jgi:hypothetical protein
MRDEHQTTREVVKDFQKRGIPMAVLKEGKWVAILPKGSPSVTFELPSSSLQNQNEPVPATPLLDT